MRPLTVDFAGLNITTRPHDKAGMRYVELFEAAFKSKAIIKLRGDTHATLGYVFRWNEEDPLDCIYGEIFRFTKIDFDAAWFDQSQMKPISPEDAMEEISIPENLHPNIKRTRYVFFPRKHTLLYASYGDSRLSPDHAQLFFESLFSRRDLRESFPHTEVNIIQSDEELSRILDETNLEALRIEVSIPNTGDGAEEDDITLEEVLEEQGAKKQVTELVKQPGKFLKPNKRNRALAALALANGHVSASGIDKKTEKRVKLDTREHPKVMKRTFQRVGDLARWIIVEAREILSKFARK